MYGQCKKVFKNSATLPHASTSQLHGPQHPRWTPFCSQHSGLSSPHNLGHPSQNPKALLALLRDTLEQPTQPGGRLQLGQRPVRQSPPLLTLPWANTAVLPYPPLAEAWLQRTPKLRAHPSPCQDRWLHSWPWRCLPCTGPAVPSLPQGSWLLARMSHWWDWPLGSWLQHALEGLPVQLALVAAPVSLPTAWESCVFTGRPLMADPWELCSWKQLFQSCPWFNSSIW